MDLNEVYEGMKFRHPWELSRTKSVLSVFSRYIDKMHTGNSAAKYINIGAGDCYFDEALLKMYTQDRASAVDIGYQNMDSGHDRIKRYHYEEETPEESYNYAIMMDSLEYMEDDVDYVKKITKRIQKDGYFFFTLPAMPSLFSEYDNIVRNLRRYDIRSFRNLISRVPELVIEREYYFYTSLFMVRWVQKQFNLPIDPDHKVTSHWKYGDKNLLTRILSGCLSVDYYINRVLSKIGIHMPGLSLLVICKRV